MAIVARLGYMLVLLAAGVLARQVGLLDEAWTDRLNAVAFYLSLPAVVFLLTYDQSLGGLVSPSLVVGLWVVLLVTVGLAWVVHRGRERARRGVAVVQSYHGNLGFLGLPLVAATFGDRVGAVASVVFGVLVVTQVPLTVFLLVRTAAAEADLAAELRSLLVNPVLWALAGGLGVSAASVPVPPAVVTALDPVSATALPLALLLVGASLEADPPAIDLSATGTVVALKVGAMPALAAAVFALLGVDPTAYVAAVVMLAMPTAVSTYVYANELGGDPQFASTNVFATTVAAVGTLFVVLRFVGYSSH